MRFGESVIDAVDKKILRLLQEDST
ncbi:transcriptional regulator, partial [Vibrio sp. 10N.222.46.B3]